MTDVPAPREPADDGPAGLSAEELAMLDFERRWWRQRGAKEQAIGEEFGISVTRYYQRLNALLDRPEALAAAPDVVKRLQRAQARRHRLR